jgi:hypothetical protein
MWWSLCFHHARRFSGQFCELTETTTLASAGPVGSFRIPQTKMSEILDREDKNHFCGRFHAVMSVVG